MDDFDLRRLIFTEFHFCKLTPMLVYANIFSRKGKVKMNPILFSGAYPRFPLLKDTDFLFKEVD